MKIKIKFITMNNFSKDKYLEYINLSNLNQQKRKEILNITNYIFFIYFFIQLINNNNGKELLVEVYKEKSERKKNIK